MRLLWYFLEQLVAHSCGLLSSVLCDSSLCSSRFGVLIVKVKTTSFQVGEYKKK